MPEEVDQDERALRRPQLPTLMTPSLSDTSPEAERAQVEILRSMPDWRRAQLWNDLMMTARKLVLAGLRERFPNATSEELRRRLATLLVGKELATKVYGPEPDPPTFSSFYEPS